VAPLVAAPAPPSEPASSNAPASEPRRRRPKKDRGPANPLFIAVHLSAGVVGTALVQTATYSLVARVGHTGRGLGPAVGSLAIGAFLPPLLNYTIQWAAGRAVSPGRDKFWPGFLVRQAVHLGVFAAAVAGGANFDDPGQSTAIVLGEALVNSGLTTLTAELTRRPPQMAASVSDPLRPTAGATMAGMPAPVQVIVPVLELGF
jgi:hypothetical protein